MFQVSDFRFQVSPIAVLLLAFGLLGFTYNATTPVFEAPDEVWHYAYVRHIAEGHGLPALDDERHGAYQEAAQPPLYYLSAALASAAASDDDQSELIWHNPGFGYQSPATSNDNKNMLVHTGREGWPWHDFTLALHLARLVSLAYGGLMVLATWGLAGQVFPARPRLALVAAGVVASTPQFAFISGVVSNDSAAAALSTAALWSIVRLARRPTLHQAALSGTLIGLAALTKTSTLPLLPLAVLIVNCQLLIVNEQPRNIRRMLQYSIVSTCAALLVGGWWYMRNLVLYGDALGLNVHTNTPWGQPQPIWTELPKVYRSFWAAFGWGGIGLPDWTYAAIGVLVIAAAVGWIKESFRFQVSGFRFLLRESNWQMPAVSFLLLWCLAVMAALLRWLTQVEAAHGRLLFPALGAGAVLLASGWERLGSRLGRGVSLAGLGLLGTLALASPFVAIRPALLPPPSLSQAQVQARAEPIQRVYGGVAELVAWQPGKTSARAGEFVPITLCWQAHQPMKRDYTVFVHILGKDNLIVGARDTWPGLGRFPTSLWTPYQPFCDVVQVQIESWAPRPAVYAVEVGLYLAETGERLEFEGGLPIVGQLVIRGSPPPPPQHPVSYSLSDAIKLIGYDLQGQASIDGGPGSPAKLQAGRPISLTLHWQAQSGGTGDYTGGEYTRGDYTVFVHALDEHGQVAAQGDGKPCGGEYPTSSWIEGEAVADTHVLALPAGLYTLSVGMYHQPTMTRLTARGPQGQVKDDAIPLATIEVK
ncbi:MAG: glycosyltransferase family 39 protein [Thermoflexales bacterium]|nr:glycosyltransferase family 39 protein [Thermoflexales bacterium]